MKTKEEELDKDVLRTDTAKKIIKLTKEQTLKDELKWLKGIAGYKINIYLKEDIEKRIDQIEKMGEKK